MRERRYDRGGKARSPATGETYEIKDGYLDLLKARIGADSIANLTNFLPGAGRGYEPLWRVRSLQLLTGEPFPNERELEIIKRLVRPVPRRPLPRPGLLRRPLHPQPRQRLHAVGIDISPSMLRGSRPPRTPGSGRMPPSSGRTRRTSLSSTPPSKAPSAAAPSTSLEIPHEPCGRPTGSSNPAGGSQSWASCVQARRVDAGSSASSPRVASGSSTPTSYRACSTTRASSQTRPSHTVPSSFSGATRRGDATAMLYKASTVSGVGRAPWAPASVTAAAPARTA